MFRHLVMHAHPGLRTGRSDEMGWDKGPPSMPRAMCDDEGVANPDKGKMRYLTLPYPTLTWMTVKFGLL